MTKIELKKKINDCLKNDKQHIQKLINKVIDSGCLDIDGAENNYILAKMVLTAIYKEMSRQYSPLSNDKKIKNEINNIYIHL